MILQKFFDAAISRFFLDNLFLKHIIENYTNNKEEEKIEKIFMVGKNTDTDLVPSRNQSLKGICPDCVKAGRPPDQTRLCDKCRKCGDIHCQCGIKVLLKKLQAVLKEPSFF